MTKCEVKTGCEVFQFTKFGTLHIFPCGTMSYPLNVELAFVVMCSTTRLTRAAARLRGSLRAGTASRKRASVAEGRCGT